MDEKLLSLEQTKSKLRVTGVPSSNLEKICEGCKEFIQYAYDFRSVIKSLDEGVSVAESLIEEYEIIPRADDIYSFVKSRFASQHKILGEVVGMNNAKDFMTAYLSALMNLSNDDKFRIDVSELNKEEILLDNLGGCLRGKELVIEGNVGGDLGCNSQNSKIIVNGNASDYVGVGSQNSKITINGNAGGYVGWNSQDTTIVINGDAEGNVGYCSKNATIIVNGDVKERVGHHSKNSKITVNGRAGEEVGYVAENSRIYIKKGFDSLSDNIRSGTKIFVYKRYRWKKVYPSFMEIIRRFIK